MRVKLQSATAEDAESIAALRNAVSDDLTLKYGRGWWTSYCTTAGILSDLRHGNLLVALQRGEAIASLNLATTKPGATDRKYPSTAGRPLYLLSMVVAPDLQRQGVGRACMAEAEKLARRRKADAILLVAPDHAAGAGEFYVKCGYRETGRGADRTAPLIYYEKLL
ncbi:MAG: GCN5-related N-acetyltransferase [Lacunisphaera sp.]|nr:GCN5-related N-acetyltransferase [Lacunisphaera sp.]MDB6166503.1 GCN5-related N-acetyltransferase [Lacunisphaera sp.]